MADHADSLVEIPEEQWPALLGCFQTGPHTITAIVAIKTQILNRKRLPNFPVQIFAPYNKPEEGIVMIWPKIPGAYDISTFYNKDNPTKLIQAIKETRIEDFNKIIFLLCAVLPFLQQPFKDLMAELKIKITVDETYIAHLPRETAKQFQYTLDDDVEIKQLDQRYTDAVNDVWPHQHPGSDIYFRNMLNRGFGYGIIGKEKQDLRAWCFISVRGDLHSLHVQEAYRRKGYAQCIVKYLSKLYIERGIEIFTCIITENGPSKSLFTRMGFELKFIGSWISNHPHRS